MNLSEIREIASKHVCLVLSLLSNEYRCTIILPSVPSIIGGSLGKRILSRLLLLRQGDHSRSKTVRSTTLVSMKFIGKQVILRKISFAD
jgi:hypothetical protein